MTNILDKMEAALRLCIHDIENSRSFDDASYQDPPALTEARSALREYEALKGRVVVVPREPSNAQKCAGKLIIEEIILKGKYGQRQAEDIYDAMIAAAKNEGGE